MTNRISIIITIIGCSLSFIIFAFIYSRYKLIIYESTNYNKHRIVLVVLDALRHDYLELIKEKNLELPNIQKMVNGGARIKKMIPAFPTVTMANHQTLMTGLFTPYHGITNNNFNDSYLNYDTFSMENQSSLNEDRWYKGYPDPIWVTCEKTSHCKSGSMLWPNTDAVINGYRPSKKVDQYYVLNEANTIVYPYDRRVDEMLDWLKYDLIDFGLLYFDEPDVTSHKFGPTHMNTLKKVVEMDGWIGRLFDGVKMAGLKDKVDIILTADHGMTELSKDKVINIDDFVPPDLYLSTYSYPVGIIYPKKGNANKVYDLYKKASSHIQVYWREDVPDEFHYKENKNRISPIVTIVDLGWIVNSSHFFVKMKGGTHGYFQEEDDMKASFFAIGPSFKNIMIDTVMNVDVYPLIMHLLGLKANDNNGSFSRISPILTESAQTFIPRENQWAYDKYLLFIFSVLLVQMTVCFVYFFFFLYVNCTNPRFGNRFRTDKIARYNPELEEALLSSP